MWWPQWVQTSWLASQSRMNSICSHLTHFSQRLSGASLRETSALSLGRTKLVSQFMAAVSHERPSRPRQRRTLDASAAKTSAPEDAERRHELLGFLHLAEQFSLPVVGANSLRGAGFEVGDDGGLFGHLVGRDRQDVLLAEPRDAEPGEVGLAGVESNSRRLPVAVGAEPGGISGHVVVDRAALAWREHRPRPARAVAQLPDLGPAAAGLQQIGFVEQADDEFVAQIGTAETERDGDQPPAVAHRAADDVEAGGADEAGLQAVGIGRIEIEEFYARPDPHLAEHEFLGVEVAIVLRKFLRQRHGENRHVARRGDLALVGQAVGVAELRGVHAD